MHSSQLIPRKNKEDQESDSEPKSSATIAKSVAPRSNSTTPTQHRVSNGFLFMSAIILDEVLNWTSMILEVVILDVMNSDG